MDLSRRRSEARSSVVAGSVWESRMKSDEVRGGIKVFNGEEDSEEGGGNGGGTRLKRSPIGGAVASGKRKTWKSEFSEGLGKNPVQIARGKSEPRRNCDEQAKELSISSDGIKKVPIQVRKLKTEGTKELGASADKIERGPIQTRRLRSEISKGNAELGKEESEPGEGPERNSGQLKKSKSDSTKTVNQTVKNSAVSAYGNQENSIQLRKTKPDSGQVLNESRNDVDDGIEKISVEEGKNDHDKHCKDLGVYQEKVISSGLDSVSVAKCSPESSVLVGRDSDPGIDDEGDEEEEEEEQVYEKVDIEIEMEKEKESFVVKEISIPESKVEKEPENKTLVNEPEKTVVVKEPEKKVVVDEPEKKVVVDEPGKKVVVDKPGKKVIVNEPGKKKAVNESEKKKALNEPEPKKVLSTHRRFQQSNERPVSVPLSVKQPPPIRRHSTIYQNFSKPNAIPQAEEYHSFPQTQSKLQSLVDLIMWRDVSRSAFVFGMGTFIVVSSSYAKDINLSFISMMSYLGLVYLAVIFLYRSLVCRGVIDVEATNYVLGEEEAIWVLELILPYLNEFLSKIKALFSGDPGTTMKLAVLLFVLARCGSSITIWKMAKFGFFGVFTVPKICSLYSAQLTAYANFWVRRFRDAWDTCSHKKAVALGIFGLVWNLSSVVARIWAVFVLFVAFRYYYPLRDEWVVEDEAGCEETWQGPVGIERQTQGPPPNVVLPNKVKKRF